jgi:hypothetical protein
MSRVVHLIEKVIVASEITKVPFTREFSFDPADGPAHMNGRLSLNPPLVSSDVKVGDKGVLEYRVTRYNGFWYFKKVEEGSNEV